MSTPAASSTRPPRDNLIRAMRPGIELRSTGDGAMPTMTGHFAVFDQWTEIDSMWEGTFMERVAPGSFAKTFQENRAGMRVTLNHGSDPQAGDKPLGPITELKEDETGAYYEVSLLDTSYNRDILPGLEAGLYGASFRFQVMKEEFEDKPKASKYNPSGIPERTIKEARVMEFGPVTFPAYEGATASVRSLTDDFIVRQLVGDPDRLRELLTHYVTALPVVGAEATHSEKKEAAPVVVQPRFRTKEDFLTWLTRKN
jgi:HK97 family phage prohead protease